MASHGCAEPLTADAWGWRRAGQGWQKWPPRKGAAEQDWQAWFVAWHELWKSLTARLASPIIYPKKPLTAVPGAAPSSCSSEHTVCTLDTGIDSALTLAQLGLQLTSSGPQRCMPVPVKAATLRKHTEPNYAPDQLTCGSTGKRMIISASMSCTAGQV